MTKTSSTNIKDLSIKQLQSEITRRKVAELKQQKTMIDKEIEKISSNSDKAIKSPKVKGSMKRGRTVDGASIGTRLIEVGSDGKGRTTEEFVTAMQEKGWKTSSKNPVSVIAAALSAQEKKKVFQRVSKGTYALVAMPENNINN